jgi:tetratricopeptide (TPR) repeat protein
MSLRFEQPGGTGTPWDDARGRTNDRIIGWRPSRDAASGTRHLRRPKQLIGFLLTAAMLATLLASTRGYSQDDVSPAGQKYLDEATQVKLTANNMNDLEKVIQLCETAVSNGLDADNERFAKLLLTSTLYEHASRISDAIFERDPPSPRWARLRQFAMRDLEKVLTYDPSHGEAQLLIARLQTLPGGDRNRGRLAAGEAVKLLVDDDRRRSRALVMRANFTAEEPQRLEDYAEAIRLDESNEDAWRSRGLYHLARGDHAAAAEDFFKLLEIDPEDISALQAVAESLTNQEKFDEALKFAQQAIELNPESSVAYMLRARIQALRNDLPSAIADLDQALKIQPSDVMALMMRARIRFQQGEPDAASSDVERVLEVRPGLPQAILMRSVLATADGRYSDAIDDVQQLLRLDPQNAELQFQLAALYMEERRPSKSIDIYSSVLSDDGDNFDARRYRAETLLSVGRHAEAVSDYDTVLKSEPNDSRLLNNLAWVLATSPQDAVRDGKRAVELATRACEETKYGQSHILSTLAAAYAETGDFESATEWSGKAVEQGKKEIEEASDEARRKQLVEQLEQLENELKSYQERKPWRELQTIEEKPDPPGPQADDLVIGGTDSAGDEKTPGSKSETNEKPDAENESDEEGQPEKPQGRDVEGGGR